MNTMQACFPLPYISRSLVSALLLVGVFHVSAPTLYADEILIDSVVATVDERPISLKDIEKRIQPRRKVSIQEIKSNPEISKLLDLMILEKLLIVEGERKNIKISDDDIKRYIDEVRAKNNLSESEFEAALQRDNTSIAAYRERVKVEILKSRVAAAYVKSAAAVTDEDVRAFIRQKLDGESIHNRGPKVHLRHILLNGQKYSAEDARKLADIIKQRLEDGDDFADLAKEYSNGPERDTGGDLGPLPQKDISPDIADAIDGLRAGEVSYLVTNPLGFQIFQVVERIDALDSNEESEESMKKIDEVPEDVKAKIKQKLESDKMEQKMAQFIDVELPKMHTVEKKI